MTEGRSIFPNLTVSENLLMYTFRRPGLKSALIEERAVERFPVLGKRRKQLAGTLSDGEQRMLSMARALTTDPEILFLDELYMGLAPLIVEELYGVVGQLVASEHLTIIMVEQFVQTALSIADHAVVMVNGELVKRGTPDEIRSDVVGPTWALRRVSAPARLSASARAVHPQVSNRCFHPRDLRAFPSDPQLARAPDEKLRVTDPALGGPTRSGLKGEEMGSRWTPWLVTMGVDGFTDWRLANARGSGIHGASCAPSEDGIGSRRSLGLQRYSRPQRAVGTAR